MLPTHVRPSYIDALRKWPTHCGEKLPAWTRSGMIDARAAKTAEGMRCAARCRAPTARGKRALNRDPGGASTRMGRSMPSLFGTCGAIAHFSAYAAMAHVYL